MTWPEKGNLHITRSVSLVWTYLFFHRSSLSLSKLLPKNCCWPSMANIFKSLKCFFFFCSHFASSLAWSSRACHELQVKNNFSTNYTVCPPVSNAIYSLSLTCFVFEISGRGDGCPPPPVGTMLAQAPVGARVKRTRSVGAQSCKCLAGVSEVSYFQLNYSLYGLTRAPLSGEGYL